MPNYTRNLVADIVNETTIDNNLMLEDGAGPPMVQLAPDGDEFGTVQDASWIEILGSQIYTGGPVKGGAALAEGANKLNWTDGVGVPWQVGWRRMIAYKDADVNMVYDPTDAADVASVWGGYVRHFLWKDISNNGDGVMLSYASHSAPGQFVIFVYQLIAGVFTQLGANIPIGLQTHVELRIERVSATNTFTFYYRTSAVGAWNVAWGPGVIAGASFAAGDDVYPIVASDILPTANHGFDPSCDKYEQIGTPNRFWKSSPECDIINSAAGAVEYAYDAGIDRMWALTGASCTKTEPGTSTVKFKLGYSDTGLDAGVTWVDAVWQTIAQVSANALAGLYDGHQYLHVRAQFNSSGPDQPDLTDFTITGKAAFSASKRYHNQMRRIKYGMSRIG